MYRSKCLPSEDEVKLSPQKGHCLFLGAMGFVGVAESAGESLAGSGLGSDIVLQSSGTTEVGNCVFQVVKIALGIMHKLWSARRVESQRVSATLPTSSSAVFSRFGRTYLATSDIAFSTRDLKDGLGCLRCGSCSSDVLVPGM